VTKGKETQINTTKHKAEHDRRQAVDDGIGAGLVTSFLQLQLAPRFEDVSFAVRGAEILAVICECSIRHTVLNKTIDEDLIKYQPHMIGGRVSQEPIYSNTISSANC
jgi:hypothetical protein